MLKVCQMPTPYLIHVLRHRIQFMAWERSFEKKMLKIRNKELKYQKLNYVIEVL